jgi:hypothetical protein
MVVGFSAHVHGLIRPPYPGPREARPGRTRRVSRARNLITPIASVPQEKFIDRPRIVSPHTPLVEEAIRYDSSRS